MKPRLPVALMTVEDLDVIEWVDAHRADDFLLQCFLSAAVADRLDAELMWGLQQALAALEACGVPRAQYRTAVRQDIERIAACDITTCA